jgi:hypothetical protein
MRKLAGLILLLLGSHSLHAVTIWGFEIPGLELQFGYDFVQNAVDNSAPGPVANSLGVAVPFVLAPSLVFRPEATVYFESMEYDDVNNRPQPVESMYDNVTVMALWLNANVAWEYKVLPSLTLVGEAGLAFVPRIPLFTAGTSAPDMVLPITAWYFTGRFLYPNVGLGALYQFSDRYTLFARVQVQEPVFNLWSNITWWDQLVVALNLGVRFAL